MEKAVHNGGDERHGHTVEIAEIHDLRRVLRHLPDHLLALAEQREGLFHIREELLPVGRERDLAVLFLEELHAQLLFQFADRVAQARL